MRYPVSMFECWLLVWVLLDTTTLNLCSAQTNEPCIESSRGEIRVIGIHCAGGVAGRVIMCDGREWRAVCDNNWHLADARVVCRQLGMSNAVVVNCRESCFGKSEDLRGVRNFDCDGDEEKLIDCDNQNRNDCGEDAGVICGCLQEAPPEDPPPDCTECPQDTCPETQSSCPETPSCNCIQSPPPSTTPHDNPEEQDCCPEAPPCHSSYNMTTHPEEQDSPETTPCNCMQLSPSSIPCSATQDTAIGTALGVLAAALGLALVGVVMGWVWHCRRHNKRQYNMQRNISGASFTHNPRYHLTKPHPSIQYSSQGPRDTPLNTSPTETSFATYDVVGSPTHTKSGPAPLQERAYQVLEGPGEGRKEREGSDHQEEGEGEYHVLGDVEVGKKTGLIYEVPIPTATLEQAKKQADTHYSSLQHH